MAVRITPIEPEHIIHPDVVGLYQLPFAGDVENSGDRLQAVANQVGIVIKVADLLEQRSATIFDMKAREALKPGPNFADTCRRQSERLLPELQGYTHRIGIGHSLGGVVITGVQHYAEEPPFTCVELCDAFNISNVRLPDFLAYQTLDTIRSRVARYVHRDEPLPATDWPDFKDNKDQNSIFAKMGNLRALMESAESRLGALALAADALLPLHIIGLDRGLSTGLHFASGSTNYLQPFLEQLRRARDSAARPVDTPAAPLHITRQPGWHSDLLRPAKLAPNLLVTLSLIGA